ncbi:MAG: GspMb/PilO family protein [Pyrinomonadaceae bacterium]
MSGKIKANAASDVLGERRQQLRRRLDQLNRSRPQALLRWPELVGLGASALMVFAVAFAYFYYLVPARNRLAALQTERGQLQQRLREFEAGAKQSSDAEATVVEIRESLSSFEGERLSLTRTTGRTAMIQELNDLMASNNLRQASSMSFTALDSAQAAGKTVRVQQNKELNIYPGLGITLSVEGSYQNLRRFVRDVEASKQFITIKSVQLDAEDQRAAQRVVIADEPSGDAPAAVANVRPATVSLRLGIVAYFQRESSSPGAEPGE